MLELYHTFNCDYFHTFIDLDIPSFDSHEQSIKFIQRQNSLLFEANFKEAISQISKAFSSIQQSEIEKFSTPVLDKLFDSTILFV
jgi:hypothetical protein